MVLAHRVAFSLWVGPIPEGMTVDHICRNRKCQNPNHLRLLSNLDNARDNGQSRKTHCPRGHEYSPENTWVDPDGARRCRECARIVKREWTAKHNNRQRI
jgi:HNH endonuclease